MRFKTSNLREACHTELVSCVGWASPDDVYSVADDHQVLRWNLVSAETQKVCHVTQCQDEEACFLCCRCSSCPTTSTRQTCTGCQEGEEELLVLFKQSKLNPDSKLSPDSKWAAAIKCVVSGKKAGGGSDLFLLTSATGRLQLVDFQPIFAITKAQRVLPTSIFHLSYLFV